MPGPQHLLVSRGYLTADDVKAFEGMDVSISLTTDESHPSKILMSARLPDGSTTVVMDDGSIQQFSSKAFEEVLKQSHKPPDSTNTSQQP